MNKNNFYLIIIFAIIFSSIFTGCQTPAETSAEELQTLRLTLPFIPNVQFAPVYVAIDKGYFSDAGFDVEIEYGNENDAVALVGAGDQYFTVASGEQVLLARSQGLPVTYVLAWYQQFPVGVASLAEENILDLEDLRGKNIGIPGLFGASYIGFRALLAAGGLTEDDVTLLSIGFNQVEAIMTGQVQAGVIYLPNEPVVLRDQGYEVNTMGVSDYLELVGNGLVTNETAVEDSPEMVEAFVGAFLQGIRDTINDPYEAYEISKNYVENLGDPDQDVQFQVLETSIELYLAPRLGYSDSAGWENMQEVLLDMGLLEQPIELEQAYTNQFIP